MSSKHRHWSDMDCCSYECGDKHCDAVRAQAQQRSFPAPPSPPPFRHVKYTASIDALGVILIAVAVLLAFLLGTLQ